MNTKQIYLLQNSVFPENKKKWLHMNTLLILKTYIKPGTIKDVF